MALTAGPLSQPIVSAQGQTLGSGETVCFVTVHQRASLCLTALRPEASLRPWRVPGAEAAGLTRKAG